VARGRERPFLLVAICAPLVLAFAPNWLGLVAGFVTTFALLGWLLRGRTLYLHGAEHRAIAALEQRRLRETWQGKAWPTRFSLRCGPNFAALVDALERRRPGKRIESIVVTMQRFRCAS